VLRRAGLRIILTKLLTVRNCLSGVDAFLDLGQVEMGGVPAVDELLPSVHVLPFPPPPPNCKPEPTAGCSKTDFCLAAGGSGNVR
jgi:hypothetical protein